MHFANASPLRELTCHIGSRSVTCHPAEATFPRVQALVKHRCACGGYCTLEFSEETRDVHCDVQQVRCVVDSDTELVLEYITSWFTIDRKLQVCVPCRAVGLYNAIVGIIGWRLGAAVGSSAALRVEGRGLRGAGASGPAVLGVRSWWKWKIFLCCI